MFPLKNDVTKVLLIIEWIYTLKLISKFIFKIGYKLYKYNIYHANVPLF